MKRINKRKQNPAVRQATAEEKAAVMVELEKQCPGYLGENQKLLTIVLTLTGVRLLYGLFYLYMSYMFEIGLVQGMLNILSTLFFFLWYSLMLRSNKVIAAAMLAFRGYGIVSGGVSILSMSFYLPFSLIFTLVFAVMMEFVEAVFCIYVLFNPIASNTVKLNRGMDQVLAQGVVSRTTLEQMAEYRNDCDGEETETENSGGEEESGDQEENSGDKEENGGDEI